MNERYEAIVIAHGVDNLYVVDTSLFPKHRSHEPRAHAMANAIRVGDHVLSQMA